MTFSCDINRIRRLEALTGETIPNRLGYFTVHVSAGSEIHEIGIGMHSDGTVTYYNTTIFISGQTIDAILDQAETIKKELDKGSQLANMPTDI